MHRVDEDHVRERFREIAGREPADWELQVALAAARGEHVGPIHRPDLSRDTDTVRP